MSFFNSKEEVINVELTSYGKFLLSKGLFKPVYYSFHDDDVLYDSDYANVSELVNKAEVRVQEETIYSKPLYSFTSPKASITNAINQDNLINDISNLDTYKVNYFNNAIGDSSVYSLYTPAWKINNLSSNFVSSSVVFGDKNLRIPQFECTLTASLVKTTETVVNSNVQLQDLIASNQTTVYLEDGTIYFLDIEELVLKIEEMNTDAEYDKFEIQIYKVDNNNDGTESYTSMKFPKQLNFVDDNGLLQNLSFLGLEEKYDESYVLNLLDVSTDKEISDLIACKHILSNPNNVDSIFNDPNVCEEFNARYSTNDLYKIISDRATGRNC